MIRKVYVEVLTKYEKDGRILPVSVTWEDGTKYQIDRVTDIRRAASLKAGGAGIRYTCKIQNQETYLFLEENRWFVEGKK